MTREQLPDRTRRILDELRGLDPPEDMLGAVMAEAEVTPQVGGFWRSLRRPAAVLAVAAAAVLLAVAALPRIGILEGLGHPNSSASGAVVGEVALAPGGYPAAGGAASVWIANDRTGELQRLDLTSETMGDAITINPPTTEPYNLGAALDGSSLWVAGFQDRSLVLVDADRLAVTRRIPIGAVPYRIAADGGDVWLTDFDGSQVLQVDPVDGSILRRIDLLRPTGIAIAPDAVWVATYEGRLVRLDRTDGTILDRSPIAEDATDLQVVDGDIWITGIHDRRLERYDPDRDAIVASTDGVTALAFIDDVPWVATTGAAVVRLDPTSLRWTGAVEVTAELDQMVAAGGNLWVVGTRDGEQVLFRVRPDAG